MIIRFFLLDLNEDLREESAWVRFWGIDANGKRILISSKLLEPYFYTLLDPTELESFRSKLLYDKKAFPGLDNAAIESKKRLGIQCKVLKISCSGSDSLSKCAKGISRLQPKIDVYESDLRLSVRYVTDWMMKPCGWHECDVEATEADGFEVESAYKANQATKAVEDDSIPELRILCFNLIAVAEKGAPKPERDPIRAIAIATSGSSKTLLANGPDDGHILSNFAAYVREFNPDVIVTFDGNRAHWPYLLRRSESNKFKMQLGRDGSPPHSSAYGHISIVGRANVDLADVYDDIPDVKVKTAAAVARFLQVPSANLIQDIDEMEAHDLWKSEDGRKRLIANLEGNARACLELTKSGLHFPMQLSAVTGLPLDHVMTAAVGFRVDSYLIKQAHLIGELIPRRKEQPFFTYRGAVVFEPTTGLHENIVVLDFSSMYPSLMMKYNLSPDTLIAPDEKVPEENVNLIPEVNHRFRKEPDGFYKFALGELIKQRVRVRRELEQVRERSTRQLVLKERERALKILTNACYGYAGWAGARWYVREVAESAAALGREAATKTMEKARALGLSVIYGDTDSVFVKEDEKVNELIDWVQKKLGLEIRRERRYVRVFFTEAMKRYAGLLPDGSLDIVGLEVIRGDWSDLARDVQEQVLSAILKDQDIEKAIDGVKMTILKLRNGEFPLSKLTIRKTLTKPTEDYRVRTPHVEVAIRLLKEGWSLSVGDKVAYVIVKGRGKLYEKARALYQAKLEDVDTGYYVDNQIKPAAMRILEHFAVDEKQVAV